LVASIGVLGVLVASMVGQAFDWRTSYWVGGGMGMVLLFLRLGVYESGMYQSIQKKKVARGDFFAFFTSPAKFTKYLCSVLIGLPVWYLVSVLLTFAPEMGKGMGMTQLPDSGRAVFFAYVGLTSGDIVSGSLSQIFRTRKKVILGFLLLASFFIILFLLVGGSSLPVFYGLCGAIGFGMGFWAVFVVVTSEQFGTNLRATATTTVPNFVRGSAILLTMTFQWLIPLAGTLLSAALVGLVTMSLSFWALSRLEETYGKNLDYTEPL
jgi:MFS family permease